MMINIWTKIFNFQIFFITFTPGLLVKHHCSDPWISSLHSMNIYSFIFLNLKQNNENFKVNKLLFTLFINKLQFLKCPWKISGQMNNYFWHYINVSIKDKLNGLWYFRTLAIMTNWSNLWISLGLEVIVSFPVGLSTLWIQFSSPRKVVCY